MTDFSVYNKEKVRLFFKYLVNAASKMDKPVEDEVSRYIPDLTDVELRIEDLTEERKQELEQKVKVYFSKNRYIPFELKLSKLKDKITKMEKRKKANKRKLGSLKAKITKCEKLLSNIKSLYVSGH